MKGGGESLHYQLSPRISSASALLSADHLLHVFPGSVTSSTSLCLISIFAGDSQITAVVFKPADLRKHIWTCSAVLEGDHGPKDDL